MKAVLSLRIGLLVLALAVILGAFGAHGLQQVLDEHELKIWHTGVEYQYYHGFGMLLLALIPEMWIKRESMLKTSRLLMLIGIFFFSGSIYLLAVRHALGMDWLEAIGPITPIGGLFFVAAWILAALSIGRTKGG